MINEVDIVGQITRAPKMTQCRLAQGIFDRMKSLSLLQGKCIVPWMYSIKYILENEVSIYFFNLIFAR